MEENIIPIQNIDAPNVIASSGISFAYEQTFKDTNKDTENDLLRNLLNEDTK